jgi:hypothetical protein
MCPRRCLPLHLRRYRTREVTALSRRCVQAVRPTSRDRHSHWAAIPVRHRHHRFRAIRRRVDHHRQLRRKRTACLVRRRRRPFSTECRSRRFPIRLRQTALRQARRSVHKWRVAARCRRRILPRLRLVGCRLLRQAYLGHRRPLRRRCGQGRPHQPCHLPGLPARSAVMARGPRLRLQHVQPRRRRTIPRCRLRLRKVWRSWPAFPSRKTRRRRRASPVRLGKPRMGPISRQPTAKPLAKVFPIRSYQSFVIPAGAKRRAGT